MFGNVIARFHSLGHYCLLLLPGKTIAFAAVTAPPPVSAKLQSSLPWYLIDSRERWRHVRLWLIREMPVSNR
jgi:hypothetical protein